MLKIYPNLQKIVPLGLQIVGLLSSLLTVKLMGSYGRKQLLQSGLLATGITHFIVCVSFIVSAGQEDSALFWNLVIILGLIVSRSVFSLTIGPITWLYLPEIVEPRVTGTATMLNWITAAGVSFIYPIVVELVGNPSLMFFFFGAYVLFGYFLNKSLMVETKGKAEWEIRKEYDEKI